MLSHYSCTIYTLIEFVRPRLHHETLHISLLCPNNGGTRAGWKGRDDRVLYFPPENPFKAAGRAQLKTSFRHLLAPFKYRHCRCSFPPLPPSLHPTPPLHPPPSIVHQMSPCLTCNWKALLEIGLACRCTGITQVRCTQGSSPFALGGTRCLLARCCQTLSYRGVERFGGYVVPTQRTA